jgi:hypothetical protein
MRQLPWHMGGGSAGAYDGVPLVTAEVATAGAKTCVLRQQLEPLLHELVESRVERGTRAADVSDQLCRACPLDRQLVSLGGCTTAGPGIDRAQCFRDALERRRAT